MPQFDAPTIEEVQVLLPAYEILGFIAKGGMGAVYQARQISLDREVAIKILPREFGNDPDFRESFASEARSMAKLNHPNLVSVYDFGEVEGMPYIVMEFVRGKALYYSAHGISIDEMEAARLTLGICEGLAHAHEAGILHRDIKPANILLDPSKAPKIGDFGLASVVESEESGGLLFGTPGYSAPELLKDPDKVDKRSDVYSAGVVLYELLTGELPGEQYVPATQKVRVDTRFDQIIRRAIHPSPHLRFDDAEQMAKELRKLLESLSGPRGALMITAASAPKARTVAGVANARPGPIPRPPAPAGPTMVQTPGTNWTLWRNVAIIIVLLVAIFGVSKAIGLKKEYNAAQKRTSDAEQLAEEEEQERELLEEKARKKKSDLSKSDDNLAQSEQGEGKPETPLQALTRLRLALSRGERTLFPPLTAQRGDSRFFFVETPMTWQEAGEFAEEHGGHLATLSNDADCTWLATKISSGSVAWLGGGPVGGRSWGWVDGSEWRLRKLSPTPGASVALSKLGRIAAKPSAESCPFFIQWHMDGENPGNLQAQLERAKASMAQTNPHYPPGTLSSGSRRYLIVTRPGTWHKAAATAVAADGHLAVPRTPEEFEFLKDALAAALGDATPCWIGGKWDRGEHAFAWITGEPWEFAAWAPGFPEAQVPDGSALRLLTGTNGGWQHVDASSADGANSFLIEWSQDFKDRPAVVGGGGFEKLKGLQDTAKNYVADLHAAQLEDVRANAKWLDDELRIWLRRQPRGAGARWSPVVQKIQTFHREDGRFEWPLQGAPRLHKDMIEFIKGCLEKQQRLDEKLVTDLEKFRVRYLQKLHETRDVYAGNGLQGIVRAIDEEIASCGGDATALLRHLADNALPERVAAGELEVDVPFQQWLKSVRFQKPDGSSFVVEGDRLRGLDKDGDRSEFNPRIREIDEEDQIVTWLYNGQRASISVALDRESGVWTDIERRQRQVKVIITE